MENKIAEYRRHFAVKNSSADVTYQTWQLADSTDLLADLVLIGEKTATSSAYIFYEIEQAPLPQVGTYNIILSSDNQPLCIIKTSKVYTTQFKHVSSDHAYKEGEGDKSLEYWQKVHRSFFTDELKAVNLVFDETIQLVCEEFEVIDKY